MYRKTVSALIALAAVLTMSLHAYALDCSDVNINNMLEETQLSSEDQDKLLLVWWIPIEYWCVSTSGDPTVTEDDLKQFEDILKDYTLIALVDGSMSDFGAVSFKTEKEVLPLVKLKDSAGNVYEPLDSEEINPDTRSFLSILKPLLGNMMGEMGESMHFVVFSGTDKDGKRIDDPAADGTLTVIYDGNDFKWRLPLGSMLADKECPKCGEKCSGAWKYCPYDGTEL